MFWEAKNADLERVELLVRDLDAVITTVRAEYPIYVTVKRMVEANAKDIEGLKTYMNGFRGKLIQNILDIPFEPKYHKVSLAKFFSMLGKPQGAISLFRSMGFNAESNAETATTGFPASFDADLFAFRAGQLDIAIKQLMPQDDTFE